MTAIECCLFLSVTNAAYHSDTRHPETTCFGKMPRKGVFMNQTVQKSDLSYQPVPAVPSRRRK
jgi:hypothetical protein